MIIALARDTGGCSMSCVIACVRFRKLYEITRVMMLSYDDANNEPVFYCTRVKRAKTPIQIPYKDYKK